MSKLLGSIVEESLDEIYVFDAKSLRFVDVNRGARENLGYSQDELCTLTPVDLKPELAAETFAELIEPLRNGSREQIEFETRHLRKDGSTYDVAVRLQFFRAERPPVFVAAVRDITKRKEAEAALHQSERRFKDFAEASSDWFWETDRELRFTWLSQQWQEITGIPAARIIGKTCQQLGKGTADDETWACHLACLRAHHPFKNFRYRLRTEMDTALWIDASGIPIFDDDGAFLGYRGVGSNVTREVEAQQRAEQARALLEDATESFPDGFVLFDADDRLVYANENYRKGLGSVADILKPGVGWERVFRALVERGVLTPPPGGREAWIQEQIAAHGKPGTLRIQCTNDGHSFEVREYKTRDGGTVIIRADVTERERAEERLRKLSCAVEQSPASVVITDTKGNIDYVNPKFENMTGYAAEEVVGRNPRMLKSGYTAPDEYKALWQTITGGGQWRGEFHNRKKNGELFWELATIGPIKAADGTITNFLAVKEDITARKESEESLQRSVKVEQALNALLAISQLALPIDVKLERSLQAISLISCFQKTLGSAVFVADIASKTLTLVAQRGLEPELLSICENVPFGHCLCGRAAATKEIQFAGCIDHRHEARFERMAPHGHYIVPIARDGALMGVLNIYVPHGHHREHREERFLKAAADVLAITIDRDRAERELLRHRDHLQDLVDAATAEIRIKARELEAALAKEREINLLQRQFVSMVSHEFRTPLTIIDGSAQRIQRRFGTMIAEDLNVRVSMIRGAVTRMIQLIDSTLSAARMDAGKIEVSPVPCDVRALLTEICDRQQVISKSHRISVDTAGLPPSIIADVEAVERIFTNLLSNAVKYAPGAPDIEVAGWTEGKMAVVSVRDHGLGIPADDLPNMFGRFFRAKTSAGIAGTGIGLNLVKQLVDLHRGSIHVDSVEGEGSTFTVKLPLDPVLRERRRRDRGTGTHEAA